MIKEIINVKYFLSTICVDCLTIWNIYWMTSLDYKTKFNLRFI